MMDMPMMAAMGLFPLLFGLIWIGLFIYLIGLATRLVKAVERIADNVGGQAGGAVTPFSRSPLEGV